MPRPKKAPQDMVSVELTPVPLEESQRPPLIHPPQTQNNKSEFNLCPSLGTEAATRFIERILQGFVKDVDYGIIKAGMKPSLYKPGAEKVCFAFNLDPQFEKDTDTLSMMPEVKNLVAYKCTLINRLTKDRVGEGRGAAILGSKANCQDPNSTIKMAQKSAMVDAALRVFALSQRYTQDVEDMDLTGRNKTQPTMVRISPTTGEVRQESL